MADNRIHRIAGAQQDDLVFKQLTGVERLGQPFCYQLEVLSDKKDISPYDVIGKTLALVIAPGEAPKRHFHGYVTAFLNAGSAGGYQRYEIELRPWLWLLTHTRNCIIYQNKSVTQIIEEVFNRYGIAQFRNKCQRSFKAREYCVQYRESDFAFVSRLMEQEGIYYYFEHEEGKHTLVMVDAASAHVPIGGESKLPFRPPTGATSGEDFVYFWQHHVEVHPGKFAIRDFDYNKPNTLLEAKSTSAHSHLNAMGEYYDYPGSFEDNSEGRTAADLIKESSDAEVAHMRGQARSYQMANGKLFSLTDHPRKSENAQYLIFETQTTIKSGEIEQFTVESKNVADIKFLAIPKTKVFRSPRVTPAPVISGPQTAIVVGKSGEEIWTDELGRVKVQFHWDRVGQKNEDSSCWVRVSQIWAGQHWGSLHIPRVGQEVIVEFIEGDPDRPIITGRVYNTAQTVPYDLPNLQTQSGIKSRTSPDGTDDTFNELRFDDKSGAESIYFHAERDFTRIVENDDLLKVGFEKKDKGDQTIEVFGNQVCKIGTSESDGSQTEEIYKDRTTTVKTGNDSLTVESGNQTITISSGNQSISIPSGECEINAGKKITLVVGGSKIIIEPSSITLESAEIKLSASMKVEISGKMSEVSGSATLTLKGGVVKIN